MSRKIKQGSKKHHGHASILAMHHRTAKNPPSSANASRISPRKSAQKKTARSGATERRKRRCKRAAQAMDNAVGTTTRGRGSQSQSNLLSFGCNSRDSPPMNERDCIMLSNVPPRLHRKSCQAEKRGFSKIAPTRGGNWYREIKPCPSGAIRPISPWGIVFHPRGTVFCL